MEKKSLNNIQEWMQQALLAPHQNDKTTTKSMIRDSKRMTAQQHLAIYQRSYVARLRACMAKQFEALEFALGAELFQQFADQYLQIYPSNSYTLMHLGQKFPNFLEETRPDKDQPIKESWPDFLIELAQFEYNIYVIFDEINEEIYETATFETPDEQLKFIPVFYLLDFEFPVPSYYMAFKGGHEPDLPFNRPSWCVVFRINYNIGFKGLLYWQYRLLKILQSNNDVSATLAAIAKESKKPLVEVQQAWAMWRKEWIKSGFFAIKTPNK